MQIRAPVRAWHDVVEALPNRRARRDHLERPDQPGFLPGLELCNVIPGVRHGSNYTRMARTGRRTGFPAVVAAFTALGGVREARGRTRPGRPLQGRREGVAQGGHGRPGMQTSFEPELARLGQAAVGVGGLAQLAGQAQLAEGGQRLAGAPSVHAAARPRRAPEPPPGRRRARPRGRRRRRTRTRRSPPSDSPPWRASTARTSASRLRSTPLATRRGGRELARRHERLDLHQQRPRALHRAEHDGARARGWPRPRSARRRPRPPRARCRASRRRPTSLVEPKRFLSARSVR